MEVIELFFNRSKEVAMPVMSCACTLLVKESSKDSVGFVVGYLQNGSN